MTPFKRNKQSAPTESCEYIAESIISEINGLFDIPLRIFFTEEEGRSKLGKSGVVEECLFFLLHCFDRASDALLDVKSRRLFMDYLVAATLRDYLKMREAEFGNIWNDAIQENLFKRALTAHLDYAQYKVNLKRQDLPNDLFWQFAKKIAAMADLCDPVIIVRLSHFALSLFELADKMTRFSSSLSSTPAT